MLDISDYLPELPLHLLEGLQVSLAGYDAGDLLASVGALHLVSENAGASLRLEVLAHLALGVGPSEGKPAISSSELAALCNETALGQGLFLEMEDPFDNPFTDAFAFYGGSYTVFPGSFDETTFVLRQLVCALFQGASPFPNQAFADEARSLLHSVLLLSDTIARRAELPRGVEPSSDVGQPIVVPPDAELDAMKRVVTFKYSDVQQLLGQPGLEPSALQRLVTNIGSISLNTYSREYGPLLSQPVVDTGTEYIVALPGALLEAARDALVQLAHEHDVVPELARRFNAAVLSAVKESLHLMGNIPVQGGLPIRPDLPNARDAVYTLDTDKALYVLLITDPMLGYDAQHPHAHWSDEWFERVESRVADVERYLLTMDIPPNEVLSLVLAQGLYRMTVSSAPGADPADAPLMLNMSAADLHNIGHLERGKPLVLWQYAQADRLLRRKTAVFAPGGEIEKFQLYRENHYSFYHDDDERPAWVNILPGRIGELRRELVRTMDIHAAPSFLPGQYIEVALAYGNREAPIYLPIDALAAVRPRVFRASSLVEGLPLPVWVLGPRYESEEQAALHARYLQIVNAIAYWLWQFSPVLSSPLEAVTAEYTCIRVELFLEAHEAWHRPQALETISDVGPVPGEEAPPLRISCDPEQGLMRLTLSPSFVALINAPDNRGERALMAALLDSTRALLPFEVKAVLSEQAISNALDMYAPLGPKRMLLALTTNVAPEMDPRGLPRFHPVPRSDEDRLLDELGEYLVVIEQMPVGPVRPDHRESLLDNAVRFYYSELSTLVSSLRPDNLLEFLVAHHEAIVREVAEHRLTMPTRVACFAQDTSMVVRFSEEMLQFAEAGTASRFIIEYVATCPPRGRRPLSYSVYNRMLALGSQIVNQGFTRDLIHNTLANIQLEILPSGRLGLDRSEYERACAVYIPLFTSGELQRATRAFGRYWEASNDEVHDAARSSVEPDRQIEEALRAEFGYTFTELLAFTIEAILLSQERTANKSACVSMPVDEFVQVMSARLGWGPQQVSSMVIALTLAPRVDFLSPEPPFKRSDVYPWRFNRRLSYLRKPFLYRKRDGFVELVWGPRHLHNAWEYVLQLCQSGRLQPSSEEMRRLLGRVNKEAGSAFNDEVANLFRKVPNLVVRTRVGKSAGIGYPEERLGDIDILVADPRRRTIKLVECKDLAIARTAHEMALERKALFEGRATKLSAVEKQVVRAQWVRQNLLGVLSWLGLDAAGEWSVEPFIIVNMELITAYLVQPAVSVLSMEELSSSLAGEHTVEVPR
ncbi:MAG: hypothetical protein ABI670_01065 [Chloroflexota bacterium]